jgi:hypothetical protein
MKHCNRCGLCCELELCSKGRRKDKKIKGNCQFLIRNDDGTTSCKLILEGKMPSGVINLNGGCIIQEDYPKMYEFQIEYRNNSNKNGISFPERK